MDSALTARRSFLVAAGGLVASVSLWALGRWYFKRRRIQAIAERHRALHARFRASDVAEVRCEFIALRVDSKTSIPVDLRKHPGFEQLLLDCLEPPDDKAEYDESVIKFFEESPQIHLKYTALDREGNSLGEVKIDLNADVVIDQRWTLGPGTQIQTFICVVAGESVVIWDAANAARLEAEIRALTEQGLSTTPAVH